MASRIQVAECDITTLDVDAIVNAANSTLLGGGGVDGSIHRAAGRGLVDECRLLGGCQTGSAKATAGHNLKARHVIHAVGPVWSGGTRGEPAKLASCYRESLSIAQALQCRTVAFPCISTGAYRFPKDLAAQIALREIRNFLRHSETPERVIIACFDRESADICRAALAADGMSS